MSDNIKIEELIKILYEKDVFFKTKWSSLNDLEKEKMISFWNNCRNYLNNLTLDQVISQNKEVYLKTRGFFSLIQEKTFRYSHIPPQWRLILDSPDKIQKMYDTNRDDLLKFINKNSICKNIDFYGGIKSLNSIEKKVKIISQGSAPRRNLIDIWDLVRYRICTNDLEYLVKIGYQIWCEYFDKIISCRNYYFIPRNGNIDDAYRAIHFQILDNIGGMFELQLVTKFRDSISLLDHSIIFRKTIQVDYKWNVFLQQLSFISNILEGKEFHGINL